MDAYANVHHFDWHMYQEICPDPRNNPHCRKHCLVNKKFIKNPIKMKLKFTWLHWMFSIPDCHTITKQIFTVTRYFEFNMNFPIWKCYWLERKQLNIINMRKKRQKHTILFHKPPYLDCWSGVNRIKLLETIVWPYISQFGIVIPEPVWKKIKFHSIIFSK